MAGARLARRRSVRMGHPQQPGPDVSDRAAARFRPEPADPFDPAHFAGLRKPYDQAETLPAWCYTSDAVYQRELERIFRRAWICLGHESQAAAPGDYFPFEL